MNLLRSDTRLAPTLILLPWTQTGGEDETLRSLLATTPPSLPVIVPGDRVRPSIAELAGQRLAVAPGAPAPPGAAEAAQPGAAGPAQPGAVLNAIARERPGTDLVVIADGVILPAGWLEAVERAAHCDDGVATATALAGGQGDPRLGQPSPLPPSGPAQPSPHPRVLWPWAHCAWIRASAWELLGGFDTSLGHVAAVLVDFGARALSRGLSCALAGGLCLKPTGSRLGPCPAGQLDHLTATHPWLPAAASEQASLQPPALRRVVIRLAGAQRPVSVTVDARALGTGVGGSQTYVSQMLHALAATGELSVRAIVGPQAPADTTAALRAAGIELLNEDQAATGEFRTDIVHRPQQVFTRNDLALLHAAGERTVISHMDLLLYRDPAYHPSPADWFAYRRVTQMALGMADTTLFFSEHARSDALAEDLVDPPRTYLAGIGAPAAAKSGSASEARRPPAIPPGRPLLLVLGSDYAHKNRPFAMALADELRRRHGWDGLLVLAGPHQAHGSTAAAEQALLSERPGLAGHVLDLGPVSAAEKDWLLANADAQILASNYEGFGLAPLESAAVGRPCIYAALTSLRDVVDPAAATIVPWDASASADAAVALLRPGQAREHHLSLLGQARARHSWQAAASAITHAYRGALDSPPRGAEALAADVFREAAARRELQERVAYGQLLIDQDGGLLSRPEQRGLMRVASRRWLRGPLLAPFRLLGSADEQERL